ncbi:MAG: nuclear transport factor 2 family protein [Armatimonadetes bacterium]|nr:nuclear transport factor 2 family protein [Armatimonadota bacterium]
MNDADEVLTITRQMLDAMYTADPEVHRRHCAEDMSSFEWYIAPYRIDGLEFHLDLIRAGGNGAPTRLDLLTPRVQVYGDTAVVNYTLLKTMAGEGAAQFSRINETRVFARLDGVWKMVHLHKSPAG